LQLFPGQIGNLVEFILLSDLSATIQALLP